MATYVDIANLAASKIGEEDQLRSPTDDTNLGRAVAAVWTIVRQAALRDHTWNFAKRRAALPAQLLDTPQLLDGVSGWGYRYPTPPDCLRVIELVDYPGRNDYQIEGNAILWDSAGPLRIRYIADVTEPALWDALFVDAMACRLAFQIADRITGDRGRKSDAWTAYMASIASAKRASARENPGPIEASSPWETARWRGWSGADWPQSYYPGIGPQIIP